MPKLMRYTLEDRRSAQGVEKIPICKMNKCLFQRTSKRGGRETNIVAKMRKRDSASSFLFYIESINCQEKALI